MAPSCPPSMRDTPCPHCFGLYYILGDFSRHIKSAHPPTSLIFQAGYVVFVGVFLSYDSP